MRVRSRIGDERGATAVLLSILLVVLLGILALAVDGGLLLSKYREVRRANDAASIAAAISCSQGNTSEALTKADEYAGANVVDPSEPGIARVSITFKDPNGNPVADCTSIQGAGKVTVRYRAQQSLMFGPAIGFSSPRQVEAAATAIWGGAGGSGDVIPMAIMLDRLKSPNCNVIPLPGKPTPTVGTQCAFWWDDNKLGSASWGLMSLATWGTDSSNDPNSCNAGGGSPQDAIKNGSPPLFLAEGAPDVPAYVCIKTGADIKPIDNALHDVLLAGRTSFALPVNDPSKQVNTTSCNPKGCTATPYKYAIVAFAFLRPVDMYKRNEAGYSACADAIPKKADGSLDDTANSWCLVASWQGYSFNGLDPGGGPAIGGIVAVGLSQ